jgi:hypothetical protein
LGAYIRHSSELNFRRKPYTYKRIAYYIRLLRKYTSPIRIKAITGHKFDGTAFDLHLNTAELR